MTLPTTGSLGISQINTEFGYGGRLADYVGKPRYKDASHGVFPSNIGILDFYGTSKVFKTSVNLSATTSITTLYSVANNAGWNGTDILDLTVNIATLVSTVQNKTSSQPMFPTGSRLRLNISSTGSISGPGGNGGSVLGTGSNYVAATQGGDALIVRNANAILEVENYGSINAGGGGGQYLYIHTKDKTTAEIFKCQAGGGGGAGRPAGKRGECYDPPGTPRGAPGNAGGSSAGGAGGDTGSGWGARAIGGAGGALGSPGVRGDFSYPSTSALQSLATPLPPGSGFAVLGDQRITWLRVGTIRGPRVDA